MGRARVWFNGRLHLHHRAIWEILVGSIPDGALLCHHCDNPACGNPAHLYIGDQRSNMRDMVGRGRHRSQKHPELSTIRLFAKKGAAARNASLSAERRSEIAIAAGNGRARALTPERRREIAVVAGQASKRARERRMKS